MVRLVKNETGVKADITLKNEASSTLSLKVLKFSAKQIGTSGNEIGIEINYETPTPEDTFNILLYRISFDGTVVESEKFLNCSMDPNSPRFPPKIITQNSKLVNCELPADPGQTQEQALENYRNQVKTQSCYSESRKFFTDGDINEVKTFLNSGTAEFMLKIDDSQPFLIDLNHTYSATDVPGMEGELKSQVNAGLPANLQDKV